MGNAEFITIHYILGQVLKRKNSAIGGVIIAMNALMEACWGNAKHR